jgi:hypothetical protein
VSSWIRAELGLGAIIAVFSTLLGAVVGLIWQAGAPHVQLAAAINGSESAAKPLIGDDVRLGVLGIIAGVVVAVVVLVLGRHRERGPGEVLGLAAGGVLGALVAARVGDLARHHETVRAIAAAVPGVTSAQTTKVLGYFGFHVRATGVLMLWPIAAVAVYLLVGFGRQWLLPRRGAVGSVDSSG